ncbi:MAG: 4-hydroxybenzoate octaprenyltransferase [Nitrospira sp.]|nr:4-hydroxybenzoate octaprenyltransferase [Nitrospira sp.]
MSDCPASAPSGPAGASQSGLDWPTLARLVRLSSQAGTWLLALPTLWGLTLAAGGRPPFSLLVIFLLGSFLMRSAGVVMNDLADRSFDRQVARTQTRPLASGALSPSQALAVVMALVSLAALLLLFLNRLALFLSPVALLLAALYPFSKRLFHIPQAVLGMAFGWGVIMAWAAVRNELAAPAWLLYGSTICWALAYDTIYALQDRDDDRKIGVKSSAIFFGSLTWLAVALAMGGMLILLGGAGRLLGLGPAFYAALVGVGVLSVCQVTQLRGAVSPARALALFKQHVWVGAAILAGIWAGFLS